MNICKNTIQKNFLLLYTLLDNIYYIAEKIGIVPEINKWISGKCFSREFYASKIEDYRYERTRAENICRIYEYVKSNLKNNSTAVSNAECSEMLKMFHTLRCKLNPNKYNSQHVLHGNLSNINLREFCYYISNTLVCISHDIVYAINEIINKLNEYKIDSVTTSNNIYNTIIESFNYIMGALTNLKSGMFFNELLCIDKDEYHHFENHFENSSWAIIHFEKKFDKVLNDIKSDMGNRNIDKINKLIKKIKEYKNSNNLMDELKIKIDEDKNLNINEKYKKIVGYVEKYKYWQDYNNKDCSVLKNKNGEINKELVEAINDININIAKETLLNRLEEINTTIYHPISIIYNIQNNNLYDTMCKYILPHIHSPLHGNEYYHSFDDWKLKYPKLKLYYNENLCYEIYYKKYANILMRDISKIIDEVFEK